MDGLWVYGSRISLRDYPEFAACPRTTDRPGVVLAEHYAVQGVRCAVSLGYFLTVAHFYLVRRPRLSFADRELLQLHHYFYPSAGYSTPVGIVGGLLYGCTENNKRINLQALGEECIREQRAAEMACEQQDRRRRELEGHLRGEQPWWTRLTAMIFGRRDPILTQLQRLGLEDNPPRMKTWRDFVAPDGLLSVAARSHVHDAAWYRGYDGPVEANRINEDNAVRRTDGAPATPDALPPQTPRFTKLQVDGIVSDALRFRHSEVEERWIRTAGRFAGFGILTSLLFWNSRGLFFRLNMGFGGGVVCGAVISATRLDETS